MNRPDDELLSRHIDGELSEHESASLELRLEQEPDLQKRLESLSQVDRVLRDTFSNTEIEPPGHVVSMLQSGKAMWFPCGVIPGPCGRPLLPPR
jgi:hypothetical protein